ncbi:peptidoglycan-binding protein [Streptomyces sp. NPDC060011]|uniref:peptidoglycan-binding domain-containing protein n=1 Tax=Streptomyces sp. NPDC060011 TaxID=3347037 RepID=UPI0036CE0EF5
MNAQTYPGASKAYWYGQLYPGVAMTVNTVVLHTTEGRTLTSYAGGKNAPNLTAVPDFAAKRLVWYQHFPFDSSSRALVNKLGGVETNILNVSQVELVGTCSAQTHEEWGDKPHIYWPQAPEWALRELAKFLAWTHTEHGVPLAGPKDWPPYPKSYGATDARMTASEWTAFSGVCGHLHAPENVHGDPGALPFARLIGYAKEYAGIAVVKKPVVDLSNVIRAFGNYPANPAITAVKVIQVALTAEKLYAGKIDGLPSNKTKTAYKAWQRRCGFTGSAADGVPGNDSLTKLGTAHGFGVKA